MAIAKSDYVFINGKVVVYEIKTELDNCDRLYNQINNYYKVFDHVAVITSDENLALVEKKIEALHRLFP